MYMEASSTSSVKPLSMKGIARQLSPPWHSMGGHGRGDLPPPQECTGRGLEQDARQLRHAVTKPLRSPGRYFLP